MKTWMKTALATALAATTALGASAVLARGGHCDGFGPGPMMHRGDPAKFGENAVQRTETHLARLELALALKPDQQAAWTQFKGAIVARAKAAGERMAGLREADRPKTTPERLQRMEEMGRAHQAEVAETRRAVEALYPRLSDAQKKVFDADFRMGPGGGREHGPHMRPGRGDGRDAAPGRAPVQEKAPARS